MSKLFPYDIGSEPSLEPPEDDREILGYCEECGEPIREGDDFYLLMDCHFCEACVDSARRCS